MGAFDPGDAVANKMWQRGTLYRASWTKIAIVEECCLFWVRKGIHHCLPLNGYSVAFIFSENWKMIVFTGYQAIIDIQQLGFVVSFDTRIQILDLQVARLIQRKEVCCNIS